MSRRSATEQIEFGDFQTPHDLAIRCCEVAKDRFGRVDTVVEPTCGEGAFVVAAIRVLRPKAVRAYEIHSPYIQSARLRARSVSDGDCTFKQQDFFALDWVFERELFDGRVLFLGNPPWVTNSQLGNIKSSNAPRKSNIEGLRGIEALTGRSNFDISESVLLTLLAAMRPDLDSLAMLVKSATARKVLRLAWAGGMQFSHVSMDSIDAKQSFGVTVDAGLLMLRPTAKKRTATHVCVRSPDLGSPATQVAFGWGDGRLLSNPSEAEATRHLQSDGSTPWRSGVKHDLARILELNERAGSLSSRDGQRVEIEMDLVYPLAKGSDVANQRTGCPERRLLIPQRRLNENTDAISQDLPKTYRYLQRWGGSFDARKSSIYRNRDRFAVFGIGDYTFAPWKVAICGLYKRLTFTLYGPVNGRGVVFDDTTYSLSFGCRQQARHVQYLLQSDLASRFFHARVFWDAKRPITAELLRGIDLARVADEMGCHDEFRRTFENHGELIGASGLRRSAKTR